MTARDAVLMLGAAVIGCASFLVWRDLWLTTLTIVIAVPVYVATFRALVR